jgi:copper chaperone CopZ
MKKILYLAVMILAITACQSREKKTGSDTPEEGLTPVAYEIVIEGMTCTGCEQTIEGSVNKLDGIKMVDADHLGGIAKIEFFAEKTDTAAIRKAITGSGYKVVAFKTGDQPGQPE